MGKDMHYNTAYPLVEIGSFLQRSKEQINIEDNTSYKRVTIRLYNKGISLRDELLGKHIGTKNQFIVREGQFLLSKIDARNGAFGVIPPDADGAIITGNFWTFDVNYSKILPEYFNLVTSSQQFYNYCQKASVGTTNRNYLQEKLFLAMMIPLPESLAAQQQLVLRYYKHIKSAETAEHEAEQTEQDIEQYILRTLGIEIQQREKRKGLNFVQFKDVGRWGLEYILGINSGIQPLFSKRYSMIPITQVIDLNPRTSFYKDEEEEISFIPMECVSDEYGTIINPRTGKIKQVKGYTKFIEGDVLWAKITPCMENGKSAIATELINGLGYGSTEFYVMRKKVDGVDIKYLHILLRTTTLLSNAKLHFSGSAGQQRVPVTYFRELEIPLPPLSIQEEIVTQVESMKNRIKELRATAASERTKAREEFEAELFG